MLWHRWMFFLHRYLVRLLFAQLEELEVHNLLIDAIPSILKNLLARVGVYVYLEHAVAGVSQVNLRDCTGDWAL